MWADAGLFGGYVSGTGTRTFYWTKRPTPYRFYFAVCHRHPAGAQAQLLRKKDKPFPIVAAGFLQVRSFLSDHCDIVCHTSEFSVVCHKPVKGSRLICDELDIQPAFLVAGVNFIFQCEKDTFSQRSVRILPNAVTGFHYLC